MKRKANILLSFAGLWFFLIFFKLSGGIHYALVTPLGEHFMPVRLIGLIVSIGAAVQMICDIPAGKLLDKYGYKKIIVLCTITFALAGALFLLKINALTIVLSIALSTVGWLFAGPGVNAYTLSHATTGNSEKFMAYRDMGWSAGIVLSCLIFPLLITAGNVLIGSIIVGGFLVAIIAISMAPRDTKKFNPEAYPHEKTHHQRKRVLKELRTAIQNLNPASIMLILLGLAGAVFYAVIRFVIPLEIVAHPEHGTILGLGMGMFDFAVVVVGSIVARFAKKFNRKLFIFFGLFLFSLMSVMSGMYLGIMFLVAAFFATTGEEMASLPLRSRLHQLDKDHANDGLISGIINFFEDIGWMIGPLIAGILYSSVGVQRTIIIGAIPIICTALLYYIAVKKESIHLAMFEAPRKPHRIRSKH